MASVVSAIRNTIPLSMFNRGLAGQIFEDVKASGPKVVMKNNVAECVLLSPAEYVRLMDELNDARLLAVANARVSTADPASFLSQEDMDRRLDFTPEELERIGEVDIE